MESAVIHRITINCFKDKRKIIIYTFSFLLITAQLIVQAGYAQGQAVDYGFYGMNKARKTLEWIEKNIPKNSKIFTNYQALQINSFTGGYYTKLLPGASATQKTLARKVCQEALISNDETLWLVFIWHPYKNKNHEASRYGPYIFDLLKKGKNQDFAVVSQFSDGVIFRSIRK